VEEQIEMEAGIKDPEVQRVRLLKVPVDIVRPEDFALLIFRLASRQEPQNIVLLSLWDLLRARHNAEYREYVERASLVIPISKSIVAGAAFLLSKRPVRYMPFDFVIRCLSALEEHAFSCYLLGGRKKMMHTVEKNIVCTFPNLHIVGRYSGRLKKHGEEQVIAAIRKSSPSLLLVGRRIRGGEFWLARHTGQLGNGLRLWCSDLFDVLAGNTWRPSKRTFDLGLEWVGYCARSPLRLFRLFPFLYYNFLLIAYKLFGRKQAE